MPRDTHARLGDTKGDSVPLTLRSSADGRTGFVANIFKGTVTIVDLRTMMVVKTLLVDTEPNPAKSTHQGARGMALIL